MLETDSHLLFDFYRLQKKANGSQYFNLLQNNLFCFERGKQRFGTTKVE